LNCKNTYNANDEYILLELNLCNKLKKFNEHGVYQSVSVMTEIKLQVPQQQGISFKI